MKYLLLFVVFTASLTGVKGGNLVLKKGDTGNETCLNYSNNSNNNGSDNRSRIVTDKITLTIVEIIGGESLPPLIIRAYNELGALVGESDEIYTSELESTGSSEELLTGVIPIEINLAFVPFSILANCSPDDTTNPISITYRIFRQNVELTVQDEIFDHPDLIYGSNVFNSAIVLCCGENVPLGLQEFRNINHSLSNTLQGQELLPSNDHKSTLKLDQDKSDFTYDQVKVFPNPLPVGMSIQIELREIKSLRIKVISMDGVEKYYARYSFPDTRLSIDTSGWSPGQYLIVLTTASGTKYKKIIVQ